MSCSYNLEILALFIALVRFLILRRMSLQSVGMLVGEPANASV